MRKFASVTVVVVISIRFVAQLMTSVCLNDDKINQSLVLLDDQQQNHHAWDECVIRLRSIESPNADALKHPKLLDHIRKKVIIDLGQRRGRTRIPVDGADEDPSTGQFMSRLIVPKFFLNSSVKYEGKFFEAGALDGKFASTTYFLERKLGWSGLLAEANPLKHQEIINSSERRALFAAACLSPETKPCHGTFGVAHLESGPVPNDVYWYGKLLSGSGLRKTRRVDPGWRVFTARVTCFPLYSLLVAANLTRIDFLSLDVESIEPHVLKTLPWEEDDFEAKVIRLDLHAGRIYARYKQFAIDFLQSKGYHFHKELLENPFVGINDVHVFSKRGYFV